VPIEALRFCKDPGSVNRGIESASGCHESVSVCPEVP
jgi:hypothetical protein